MEDLIVYIDDKNESLNEVIDNFYKTEQKVHVTDIKKRSRITKPKPVKPIKPKPVKPPKPEPNNINPLVATFKSYEKYKDSVKRPFERKCIHKDLNTFGYVNTCKDCRKLFKQLYYVKHREKFTEQNRLYRESHKK